MVLGGKYVIRHTTSEMRGIIREVHYKMNINNLEQNLEDKSVVLNEIARITIKTSKPIFYRFLQGEPHYRKHHYH